MIDKDEDLKQNDIQAEIEIVGTSVEPEPSKRVFGNTTRIEIPRAKPAPTWGEKFLRGAKNINFEYQGVKAAGVVYDSLNYLNDEVPEDWDPLNDESIEGLNPRYFAHVWNAKSPKEQMARRLDSLLRQEEEEYYSNGSYAAELFGGIVGGILSPTMIFSWGVPILAAARYAKFSQQALYGALREAPAIAATTAMYEGVRTVADTGADMEDFVLNTMIDTTFGMGLAVAGAPVKYAYQGANLWSTRKLMKSMYEGVEIGVKQGSKGKILGYQAYAPEGSSVGAQAVNAAQKLLDEGVQGGFMFEIAKKIGGLPIIGSPLIQGLDSSYASVRSFTQRLVPNSLLSGLQREGIAKDTTAQEFLNVTRREASQAGILYDQLYLSHIGVDGKFFSGTRKSLALLKDKSLTTYEDFGKLVSKRITTDIPSEFSTVNKAADLAVTSFEKNYKEYLRLNGFDENILPPRTAMKYMMVEYDKPFMILHPEEWSNTVTDILRKQDTIINNLRMPIAAIESKLTGARALPKTKETKELITKLKSELAFESERLNKSIASGEVDSILLEDRVMMNQADREKLEGLWKPLRDAEEKLKTSTKELNKFESLKTTEELLKQTKEIQSNAISSFAKVIDNQGQDKTIKMLNDYYKKVKSHDKVLGEEKIRLREQIKEELKLSKKPNEKVLKLREKVKEIESGRKLNAFSAQTIKSTVPFAKDAITKTSIKEIETQVKAITKAIKNIKKGTIDTRRLDKAKLREQVKKQKQELERLKEQVHLDAEAGIIPERFRVEGIYKYSLRDLNIPPQLRKSYGSDEARREAAIAMYNSITNMTDEQVSNAVFGKATGTGGVDPTKQRIIMLPHNDLLQAGFAVSDIPRLIKRHANVLGKRNALKKAFADVDFKDGVKSITIDLTTDYQQRRQNILNKKLPKKEEKKLLDKESKIFNKEKKFLSEAYDAFMGNPKGELREQKISNFLRSWSAASFLGGVPILQMAEIGTLVFKSGMWPAVRNLVETPLRQINRVINKSAGKEYRESSKHALVGMDSVLSNHMSKFSGQNYDISGGVVVDTMVSIGQKSGNLFGTNYFQDALQNLSANTVQSEILDALSRFKLGRASRSEKEGLLLLGIQPEEWADRFLDSFKKADGTKTTLGGYVPNWYKWADLEASEKMGMAIRLHVKQTVLEADILDKPFWTRNPIVGLMANFWGYGYSAFNNIVLPTMQRPDANKILGLTTMFTIGAIIDPVRKFAMGEEYDFEEEAWVHAAISNSGILGWPMERLEELNVMLDIPWLRDVMPDRFRNREPTDMILGPSGALLNNFASVLGMIVSGEYNQRDAKKAARITPYASHLLLRGPIKKYIEGTELPKNRSKADPWFQ